MVIGRNIQILLVVMFLSVAAAYMIAYYLPSQGINILTFGMIGERPDRDYLCCTGCYAISSVYCKTTCARCYTTSSTTTTTTSSSTTTTTPPTECTYGTVSAASSISFSTYKIFSDVGSSDQWSRILVKATDGSLVDSKVINQGDSASFTSLGLKVRVISIKALSDGTIVGVDVGVSSLDLSCLITSAHAWAFRKPVNIESELNLTNYQTLITIDTASLISAGKMRADCGDMRFIDSDGTNMTYWIESGCNSGSTQVWVKIPSILSGSNTIYFNYGNPYAKNESSSNTFMFFENFDDNSLNATKWKTYVANGGAVSESGRELVQNGDSNSWGANSYTNDSIDFNSAIITFTARHPTHSSGYPTSALYLVDRNTVMWNTSSYATPSNNKVLLINDFNGDAAFSSCTFRVIIFNVNITHVTYNSTVTSGSCANGNVAQKTVAFTGVIGSGGLSINFGTDEYGSNPTYWDNITVRKFASVEPTISIGNEETLTTTTTTTTNPPGCARSKPSVQASPTSVSATLGKTYNFTANVTNMDDSQCGNTTFAFNGSTYSYTLLGITVSLFNFSASPSQFTLAPGDSQQVNFSFGSDFTFATNYSLNVTATDITNSTHFGIANLTYNVSESFAVPSFKCSSISSGHKCDLLFTSNYIDDVLVLFLVSNSKGKVVSSGGVTAVFAGDLSFNFYCNTFGSGDYHISWIAYKGSDTSMSSPISYSTSSEEKTVTCA